MLTFLNILCFTAIFTSATRLPATKIATHAGKSIPGRYIIQLKAGTPSKFSQLGFSEGIFRSVTHTWVESHVGFNGFAGNFTVEALQDLIHSPNVEYIEEDGIVTIQSQVTQADATWGLARLSQDAKLTNSNTSSLFNYSYDSSAGQGVDIYSLDTGVYIEHSDFGGRARWGTTFGGFANADGNGHGTHTSATAAGTRFGVAKRANIIAVKVLSDQGSGTISDMYNFTSWVLTPESEMTHLYRISGINWIISSSRTSGRPSVVLMALGGGVSLAMDNAVTAATTAGVNVVVAAGHSGTDASNSSPGRVPSAITVAGCSIADAMVSGSNYGPLVDLFAPGVNVLSAWIGNPTATMTFSGSSMVYNLNSVIITESSDVTFQATAHVTGLVAYYLGILGPLPTASVESILAAASIKGVLTGVPAGTTNNLASNNLTRVGIKV